MIRTLFDLIPAGGRKQSLLLFIVILVQALAQAAAYVLLVPLLEALFGHEPARAWGWVGPMMAAVAVMTAFGILQATLGLRVAVPVAKTVQSRLGERLSHLPLGWFDNHSAAPIAHIMVGRVREIQQAVSYLTARVVGAIVVPMGVGLGMLIIDWRMSLAMLIAAPVLWAANHLGRRLYRTSDLQVHRAAAEADSRVVEFAQAQPVLRAFGAVGTGSGALDTALYEHKKAVARSVFSSVSGLIIFSVIVQAVFLVLTYLAIDQFSGATLSAAQAIALIAVGSRFIEPVNQLGLLSNALRSAAEAANEVRNLLDEKILPEADTQVVPGPPEITFDNVDFGYRAGEPILSGAGFTVPARTTTAIVGRSGAGKSTLLRLAARFYDVDAGAIRVGGHDVREQPSETLLAQMSLVFQDVYLFNRSIFDNIRVGRPDAGDDEVRHAAEVARVDEIVERLPNGYDTVVGEGGASLSGGERQRVSIARALLKDAPIVLLDEATSALDPHNEAVVVRGIHELTRDRTVVVVAHRLSTITHADQILFVDAGRIVEQGTHSELVQQGGQYAAFCGQLSRAAGWRLQPAGVT